ncbi:MAG: hypothetical protein AMK70_16010 [Nitrospira bacterium SG8_35_1]|nr:MAG: hypothetical protein AMK70_16010 [Nitrospira bacterium SG8_35_1]
MNLLGKQLINAMRWLWRFLTSRNTAIVLLTAISLVLLIGAVLPNPALITPERFIELQEKMPALLWLGEQFNSMKVGKSFAFTLIGLLLILSTTFCSIDRLIKKKRTSSGTLPELPHGKKMGSFTLESRASDIERALLAAFKRDRWKTISFESKGSRVISGSKGDVGFWGSIFFHAILVTLLAGLIAFYFSGFYASIRISEGQEFILKKDNLHRIDRMPVFGIKLPDLVFTFHKFTVQYYDDYTATDFTAFFTIKDIKTGKSWEQIFKINEPFRYRGIDFLMVVQGYSPNFILYENDVPVFNSVVALEFDTDFRDSFDIREQGMRIVAQFFPDMERNKDGSVYSKTRRPKNPYFGLEIYKDGIKVIRKLVARGEDITFGPYRLVFRDLHHWITLHLVRETGIGFFFACAMVGLVGVLMRILDPERQILASIEDTSEGCIVNFYHSSRHFEGLLKENINEIITTLKMSSSRQ